MTGWRFSRIATLLIGFAFLYAPIVLLVIYSFNASRLVTVWAGFSTRWYGSLLHNEQLLDSGRISLELAALSAAIATVLARRYAAPSRVSGSPRRLVKMN